LRRAIAEGVADGTFPAADPNLDALFVMGLCSWLDQDVDRSLDDRVATVAAVADFALAALKNPQRRSVATN
jgi:hypothetical protein